MSASTIRTVLVFLAFTFSMTACSTTQRLADRAGYAAEREAAERVDRGVSAGADAAEDAVLSGGDGAEASSPGVASGTSGSDDTSASGTDGGRPGSGSSRPSISATNDFESGTRTLVLNDFTQDNLGDFPRHFELIDGSFEIVEWDGGRYLRALSGGIFAIPLPETLPERFTIETAVSVQHGNGFVRIMPGRWWRDQRDYRGSAVTVQFAQAGVQAVQEAGPSAMRPHDAAIVRDQIAALQVMADGDHMKVYLNGLRVANVPKAVFPRTDTLFVALDWVYDETPILMGPIRVASGGRDLYSALERDGRVALEGIYFDTGSDQLRSESHATLAEVGTMLSQHPDLSLSIEGHTDSQGDDAYNLDLSDRRAASVRRYLVDELGIEAARLSSRGLGEAQPVSENDTPEGRQQNRRVELVRMP
jgi:outer membrane protein OmpA-like peptidoglycan-associated protein